MFSTYKISTQTLIVSTTINIDCQQFYDSIQCFPINYIVSQKNRMIVPETIDVDGTITNPRKYIEDGSIIFSQYKESFKGTNLKKVSEKYFLNSVTIIMKIDEKYINIKVSNKGKLQITGCNRYEYAIDIVKYFWIYLQKNTHVWNFMDEQCFKTLIIPVMCNINFSIGFHINREVLNNIINQKTPHTSILEPSDGYVGVNIKIVVDDEPIEKITIDQVNYNFSNYSWEQEKIKYMEYISSLPQKEQKKKISKCLVNTFLVFYSGKVIMSGGISWLNRKVAYETFMEIINFFKDEIITHNK